MTSEDYNWIRDLLSKGLITSPVLELGTGYGGQTSRSLMVEKGLTYIGTDLDQSDGVDVPADFEDRSHMKRFDSVGPFGSVLILNVLEHTFNPVQILDNALTLIRPGGTLVVLVPAIWPLHNYPMDAWRILPNFYEHYAVRRGLHIEKDTLCWIQAGQVSQFKDPSGSYTFPPKSNSAAHRTWSRLIHRLFNTTGRGTVCPSYLATAAVFRVPR